MMGAHAIRSDQEALLQQEHDLRARMFDKRDAFKSPDARRHFNEGFVRRHYMLQSSRLFLAERAHSDRTQPLSPYEATDCAIHVNAYYLNLRGALDNIAWTLRYEWQVLPGVSEDVPKGRQACNVFSSEFRRALQPRNCALASILDQHADWGAELAELRDPAAHRIPIYVPPMVMTSQHQVDEFRRIGAQGALPARERGGRFSTEIC